MEKFRIDRLCLFQLVWVILNNGYINANGTLQFGGSEAVEKFRIGRLCLFQLVWVILNMITRVILDSASI